MQKSVAILFIEISWRKFIFFYMFYTSFHLQMTSLHFIDANPKIELKTYSFLASYEVVKKLILIIANSTFQRFAEDVIKTFRKNFVLSTS